MSKGLLKLLFLVSITSQVYSQQNHSDILFVGHAYGSQSANDKSLDPVFLEHVYNNSQNYDEIILGGDFLYNCQNSIEFENFYTIKPQIKFTTTKTDYFLTPLGEKGKKVSPGSEYNSFNNPSFLSVNELKRLVKKY